MTAAVIVLTILLIMVTLSRFLLQQEIRKITEFINQDITKNPAHTPRMLSVGTQNKTVADLAVAINGLYQETYEKDAQRIRQVKEVRQSMADISHDLRTPLTAMIGYLKLMHNEHNTIEQNQQYLEITYEKANALHQLVNSLFDLSRLESGSYHFNWEIIDIQTLLSDRLAFFYDQFRLAGTTPTIDLGTESLRINGDHNALQRVFDNLLQNALKHGSGEIEISAGQKNGKVHVEIINAAPNLLKKDIPNLFTRAYVADTSRSRKNSGLGLAIVKEFTTQMLGDITAEWKDGKLYMHLDFPET